MSSLTIRRIAPVAPAAACLLALVLTAAPAAADSVTIDFIWLGDAGHSAQGSMTYNDNYPTIDIKYDFNTLPALQDLAIAFFDPANTLLFQTNPVVAGVNYYTWLELHFDTTTQTFFGQFDIGADSADGDLYLAGEIGAAASLIEHWMPDNVDGNATGANLVVTASTTEPAHAPTPTAFAAASFALLAVALRRRRPLAA